MFRVCSSTHPRVLLIFDASLPPELAESIKMEAAASAEVIGTIEEAEDADGAEDEPGDDTESNIKGNLLFDEEG